jgi:hypothetical protein
VRFDLEQEQPARGKDGFCQECAAGEVGEAISQVRLCAPNAVCCAALGVVISAAG